ncbi:ARF GTPase-activating protein GIT2 [Neodiprion fabricii]|uniref:ARF GTPase-activating protein GIT2 n=1 Tax=Neodiprion fabricii TaxID=2872261 RepID=UPI001ED97612|nr:ARF GTPase-activating protein GIT2 [Neodiprion fabricii]
MARPKHRGSVDTCADCGAPEPGWASLNRAILLCDECCSIHRSLGRHVSHIKSLHKGIWSTYLLSMVRTLNNNGANSIWEHSLLDPSNSKISRRKPQPKDLLHPVKADFIKAKHQQLAFILRPSKEEICSEEELSRQLHSSVRTANLETSLRLLAQGANPNYFYQEKGTTPLHVAAKAGQALQLELLIANGGNPSTMDSNGQTAAEHAKMAGHLDLAERIIESMYEVTDRLTYHVCARKPDHRLGQHLIIPQWGTTERNEMIIQARNKLQMLPNHLLEELAMDVYDEVDRRETEAIWMSNASLPERCTVPFLPVNPQLSSTRNQGRQKLARFTVQEFAILIIDLLTEAKQRHMLTNNTPPQDPAVSLLRKEQTFGNHASQVSDDEPLYDSVASDDDYAALTVVNASAQTSVPNLDDEKALAPMAKGLPSVVEVLKKQLTLSDSTIRDLRNEIRSLQSTVERLSQENCELRNMIQAPLKSRLQEDAVVNGHVVGERELGSEPILDVKTLTPRGSQRPASMYETREGLRKSSPWSTANNQAKREVEALPRPNTTQSLWDCGTVSLPPSEEVTRRTEQVTRRIQELWMAMQEPSCREAFVPCAEKIRVAVAELTAIFPPNPMEDNVRSALRQLNGNTGRLQAECAGLQRCTSDTDHMDRCLQQVRSCAYDIAKATKLLVTQFQVC